MSFFYISFGHCPICIQISKAYIKRKYMTLKCLCWNNSFLIYYKKKGGGGWLGEYSTASFSFRRFIIHFSIFEILIIHGFVGQFHSYVFLFYFIHFISFPILSFFLFSRWGSNITVSYSRIRSSYFY